MFDVGKSESWKDERQHILGLNEELGMRGVGQYGMYLVHVHGISIVLAQDGGGRGEEANTDI